ncbi:toll/interleukin-1 receptor domain-containing protein [Acidithiobacillus ferriphilus]|uniref:toll/interleukin-1 receptor domain-containing protein n=1 Tax=Acidithiobacillus ferriphilus TaxID=1689834 RepID=UPI001C0743CE|nr:toll/interleukin-1 receptor domain-containing protein [Acidithiobacillus ferriphilus]MBU2854972.1 TIR domain-containing protein [Acidithiobacillus ferriphilus]
MTDPTRPLLVVYVAWHPGFAEGAWIAEALRKHFRRELYENVAGGTGLSVLFRSVSPSGTNVPLPIDLNEAETTAVVVLADPHTANDDEWLRYIHALAEQTEAAGLGARVFPVAIEQSALLALDIAEQALRWDYWDGSTEERQQQLVGELAYEFSRMLRHYLEHLKRPAEDENALEGYLRKVQVFLSHSKHDNDGEKIACAIRERLQAGHGLSSFFDVHDIPAGLRFNKVLLQQVRVSAMVAIHTDSYSSREWCRQEVIEAKRWNVPFVVANSLSQIDERGFPYMGNVPIVRLDPNGVDRIDVVIRRLLDEVLKDFLWRCRVELATREVDTSIIFVPRPPELITLASLPPAEAVPSPIIVYPDPPLSAEEERLFAEIAPRVQLRSLTEWLAGALR